MSNGRRRHHRGASHDPALFVVECLRSTDEDDTNLIRDHMSFLLDQRAFGPRRLLIFFTDERADMHYLTHCPRHDDLLVAVMCSIDTVMHGNPHAQQHVRAAVVFNDEPVSEDIPGNLAQRFEAVSAVFAAHGITLVDWWMCDDQLFRSMRFSVDPNQPWWPWPLDESAA